MHRSIRNELENLLEAQRATCAAISESEIRAASVSPFFAGYLDGNPSAGVLKQHLTSCGECAGEVAAMQAQNGLFRSLKPSEELEPVAGFYARVMQRIEERAKDSIWAVFVYSPLGKRFALASLSVALLLGSYVVAQEKLDGHLMADTVVSDQQVHYDAPMDGDQAQQRDAVLQNFAAHSGETR